MMKTRWIMLAGLIPLLLAGCSGGAEEALSTRGESNGAPAAGVRAQTTAPVQPRGNTVVETPQTFPFTDTAGESVRLARQDLARKLGVAVDGVTVSAVIGQEFSSNAFYCRTVKERIARDDPPADIPGFTILLKAAGRRYEYHASGKIVIFCRPVS